MKTRYLLFVKRSLAIVLCFAMLICTDSLTALAGEIGMEGIQAEEVQGESQSEGIQTEESGKIDKTEVSEAEEDLSDESEETLAAEEPEPEDTSDEAEAENEITETEDSVMDINMEESESVLTSDDGFTYTVKTDGTAKIMGFSGTMTEGALVIPETVGDEISVTEIEKKAFENNTEIKSVEFPDTITQIGQYAFSGCSSLKTINYPIGLKTNPVFDYSYYRGSVFAGTAISTVTIPEGVTAVPNYIFGNMTSLASVTLPSTITSLEKGAFYGCTGLETINFPANLETINTNAFVNCSSLRSIDLSETKLVALGDFAFSTCSSITEVKLPDCTETLGYRCFYNDTSLKSINYPKSLKSINSYNYDSEHGEVFSGCAKLLSMTVPSGVTTIPKYAFYRSSIKYVTLSDTVTTIEDYSFAECTSLLHINIPSTVTTIATKAFSGSSNVTIHCKNGSAALEYAVANGISYDLESEDYGTTALTGTITNAEKKGIKDVSVMVYSFGEEKVIDWYSTDEDGKWVSDGLDIGSLYRVTYYHKDYTFSKSVFDVTLGEDDKGLDVTASALSAVGDANPSTDFTYETAEGNHIRILSYTGSATTVVFPETIDGKPVTEIGSNVFSTDTVTAVVLPDSLVKIDSNAFAKKKALVDVRFNAGLTTIGAHAFDNCTGLTSLSLPNTLTTLDINVFSGCTGLTEVYLPDSLELVNANDFSGCTGLTTTNYPANCKNSDYYILNYQTIFDGCSALASITIPDGVKTIAPYFFEGISNSISITIPGSVKTIGSNAFCKSTGLATIVLPEGLEKIKSGAFCGCSGFTEIVLPDTITEIDAAAFKDCTGLTEINYPKSWATTSLNDRQYGYGIFEGCSSLKTVTIPEGITKLCNFAFFKSEITGISLPATLTEIGDTSFGNCTKLEDITLPASVTAIPQYAFSGCTSLTSITGQKVTSVGDKAFLNCTKLSNVNLSTTVSSIGASCFKNCTALSTIHLYSSLENLGSDAFSGCTNLIVYVPKYSYAAVAGINQGLSVMFSDPVRYEKWNSYIDEDNCSYYTSFDAKKSGGTISFVLEYSINEDDFNATTSPKINFYNPAGTTVDASSIKIDGALTSGNFKTENNVTSIKVKKASGKITFDATKSSADSKVLTYATFTGKRNDVSFTNVVDVISDNVEAISLFGPDVTSEGSIAVYGYAQAESAVNLYVDSTLKTTVTTNKVGYYSASLEIPTSDTNAMYSVKAELKDDTSINATHYVSYDVNDPVLTQFDMIYYGRTYDILSGQIKSVVYHLGVNEFNFAIDFDKKDQIESVYVVGISSNIKLRHKATYNEETGKYEVSKCGFSSLPENLSVEYSLKGNEYEVMAEADVDAFKEKNAEFYKTEGVTTSTGTTGIGAFAGDSGVKTTTVNINSTVPNEKNDTDPSDDLNINMTIQTAQEPISEDQTEEDEKDKDKKEDKEDDEKNTNEPPAKLKEIANSVGTTPVHQNGYWRVVDTRDSNTTRIYVYQDGGTIIEQCAISGYEDFVKDVYNSGVEYILEDAGEEEINDLFDGTLSVVGLAADLIESYQDYNELIENIEMSPRGEDYKSTAREVSDEYLRFRICWAGAMFIMGLAAPECIVGVLLVDAVASLIVNAYEEAFEEYLLTGKAPFYFKWLIDPSGYVYDADTGDEETGERLLDVKCTIYYIEYDGSADFWDTQPSDDTWGAVWDAENYSQLNPMYTDSEGCYGWDVIEGWWRVKYEKEGYVTGDSGWMQVPPPQMDVNIGLECEKIPLGDYYYSPIADQTYTGSKICPKVVLKDNKGNILYEGKDYTLSYKNNVNVSTETKTATIVVKGKGNYKSNKTPYEIPFNIVAQSLGDGTTADSAITVSISDKQYNGKKQVSKPVLKYGKYTLKENKDYTLTYSDDVTNAGTVTVTVTAKAGGNYTGGMVLTYNIEKRINISSVYVAAISNQTYSGSATSLDKLGIVVKSSKKAADTLAADTDYTLSYDTSGNTTNVGKVTVIITGKGNYYGSKKVTFKIVQKMLQAEGVTVDVTGDTVYTGGKLTPELKVKTADGTKLVKGTDYKVAYSNNVNVATADAKAKNGKSIAPTAKLTFIGNYSGTATQTFAITAMALTKENVSLTVNSIQVKDISKFAASSITATVKLGKKTLKKGSDYTIDCTYDSTSLWQVATINFKGNYSGLLTGNFKVYTKATRTALVNGNVTVSFTNVDDSSNPIYTGSAIKPVILVKDSEGNTLSENRDYKVTLKNNVNAANKSAKKAPSWTVAGLGAFSGSVSGTFTIAPQTLSADNVTASDLLKAKKMSPKVTVKNEAGKTLKSGTDYTASLASTDISESVNVKITAKSSNYTGSVSVPVRIYKTDVSKLYYTVESQEYTGKQLKPEIKVYTDKQKKNELSSENYTVSYGTNKLAGFGTVTVTGSAGTEYGGSKTIKFIILPKWLIKK